MATFFLIYNTPSSQLSYYLNFQYKSVLLLVAYYKITKFHGKNLSCQRDFSFETKSVYLILICLLDVDF